MTMMMMQTTMTLKKYSLKNKTDMIKQFDEFINESKQEENGWREMLLYTDNVQNIYSYKWGFVETLVSRGEKDNKNIAKKLLKDNYYLQEVKHILSLVKDENDKGLKKGYQDGLADFNSLPEKTQLQFIADNIADELEDYDEGK